MRPMQTTYYGAPRRERGHREDRSPDPAQNEPATQREAAIPSEDVEAEQSLEPGEWAGSARPASAAALGASRFSSSVRRGSSSKS